MRFNLLLLLRHCGFQLRDRRLVLLIFVVLFKKFIEQHRVHRFIPNNGDVCLWVGIIRSRLTFPRPEPQGRIVVCGRRRFFSCTSEQRLDTRFKKSG